VEQLSGLPQGAGEAAGVAAGEPVAGRAQDRKGQRGWARSVRGPNGARAGSRGRAGLPGDPRGLVFWRQGVSEGVAGADDRKGGGVSLRGGTAGERGAEGARDRSGGIAADRMEGGGPEASAQGRREQGAHCAAVAGGDGDEAEMDRGGVADGCLDARVESAVQAASEAEMRRCKANCVNV